ncbi:MAG: leucine-rich repeat domain-containing protein, partial [Flavobacteriaceae bacterium]
MVLKKYSLLLLFSVVMAHTSSAQSYQEYVALFELHYQTNGHDWNKKWNFDIPVYMWEGVTVENGHVVALDLSDNNLEGKIPLTFAYLKHLKHLNLSGNKLKGKLSRGFGKLVKLESLNLADNNLTGKLPKRLA